MQLLTRLNLRHNWPLLVAFTSFLVVYGLFSSIHSQTTAPFYQPAIGEKVVYENLLAQHSKLDRDYPAILVLVTAGIALASLFGLSQIPRHKALLSVIFVIFALWWTTKMCFDSSANDGTVLRHLQSINFKGMNYKLTLSLTLGSGADWVERDFLVYECGEAGQGCTLVKFSLDEKYARGEGLSEATLHIGPTTDALYLKVGDQKTLIAQ